MQAMILNSESKSDFKLILEMADKLGIQTKILSTEEIEDFGLLNAIKLGETGELIEVDLFLEKLTK